MLWVIGLMAGGVVGLVLVLLGLRGSPVLSTPCCRKCGYDLRGFTAEPPARCSECGADLASPRAVVFGRFERRPKRVAAGVLLLLATGATTVLLSDYLSARFAVVQRTSNFTSLNNATLLAILPNEADNSPYWDELADRLVKKTLAPAEVDTAVNGLVAYLTNQPLSLATIASRGFVMAADKNNLIDPARFDRLVGAVFKPQATVAVRPTIAPGASYDYYVDYENNNQTIGEYDFVKTLTEIHIDHGTVTIEDNPMNRMLGHSLLDQFEGRLKIDAPPGPHTLTFVVDAALLNPGSTPPFGGAPGPPAEWPTPRKKWSASVSVPVTVVKAGEPTVRLVTDPKLDPLKTGALKVPEVKVAAGMNGPQFALQSFDLAGTPVAQAYTVTITVDGVTYDLGTATADPGRSTFTLGSPEELKLSPAATTATMRFTPAPDLPSTVDHIWGLPVELKNVPLRRDDLMGRHRP